MSDGLPIVTERLVVRPYEPADVDFFHALRNDPDVARYQTWSVPYPREKSERVLGAIMAVGRLTPGEWFHYIVVDRATGEAIGDLPVNLHESFPVAEIGYSFATGWQGRGFATEAASALVAWLFEHHRLRRLEAYLHPDNLRSARLLERLGFLYEGTKRLSYGTDDDPSDDPVYGLLRTDWAEWNERPLHAPVELRLVDVTPANLDAVAAVTLHRSQERVTPTAVDALLGTLVAPRSRWHRAIEADGTIVGFATGERGRPLDAVTLVIDRLHQQRGIAERVATLVSESGEPAGHA